MSEQIQKTNDSIQWKIIAGDTRRRKGERRKLSKKELKQVVVGKRN